MGARVASHLLADILRLTLVISASAIRIEVEIVVDGIGAAFDGIGAATSGRIGAILA